MHALTHTYTTHSVQRCCPLSWPVSTVQWSAVRTDCRCFPLHSSQLVAAAGPFEELDPRVGWAHLRAREKQMNITCTCGTHAIAQAGVHALKRDHLNYVSDTVFVFLLWLHFFHQWYLLSLSSVLGVPLCKNCFLAIVYPVLFVSGEMSLLNTINMLRCFLIFLKD